MDYISQQNTHGLEAILAALQLGGRPIGNLGQIPVGLNPSEQGSPLSTSTPMSASPSQSPSATSTVPSTPSPAASATSPVDGKAIGAILQALLGRGAGGFNAGGLPVG